MEIKYLPTIKSIIYIVLLLYSGFQVAEDLRRINIIIDGSIIEADLNSLNLKNDDKINPNNNSIYLLGLYIDDITPNSFMLESNRNNQTVSFTLLEFKTLINLLMETFLYFNVIFMLLIFLSLNGEGLLEYLKEKFEDE